MTGREVYLAHSAWLRELGDNLGRRLALPDEDLRRLHREANERLAADGYAALAGLDRGELETLFLITLLRCLRPPAADLASGGSEPGPDRAARLLLARLGPSERLALRLHLGEGMPLAASADATGIPSTRARGRLRRLAVRLRKMVKSAQPLKIMALRKVGRHFARTIFKTAAEKPETWPSNQVEGREKPLEPREG